MGSWRVHLLSSSKLIFFQKYKKYQKYKFVFKILIVICVNCFPQLYWLQILEQLYVENRRYRHAPIWSDTNTPCVDVPDTCIIRPGRSLGERSLYAMGGTCRPLATELVSGYSLLLIKLRARMACDGERMSWSFCVTRPVNSCWICSDARNIGFSPMQQKPIWFNTIHPVSIAIGYQFDNRPFSSCMWCGLRDSGIFVVMCVCVCVCV